MHGCAVAIRLLHARPELRGGLRLVDPSGSCLADWTRRAWGQGMEAMRSPAAHHLDVEPESLLRYAQAYGREAELAPPYHRPSLQLFMDHSRRVFAKYRLEELVVPTTVVGVEQGSEGYRLACADGTTLQARWLVLAPGLRGQAHLPAWAAAVARRAPSAVAHVEQVDIRREDVFGREVLVVGGGLSAATLADAALRRGARVALVSPHRLTVRLFDADPGWVGPKYLGLFQREPDAEARLRMIRRARGGGSVTPELLVQLRSLEAEGRLRIREEDEVVEARWDGRAGVVAVKLRGSGPGGSGPEEEMRVHRVWCCTGSDPRLERLGWLGALAGVPACDGRPVIGPTLELHPGAFVTGWLAELWVGPAARNISGARYAAGCIVNTLLPRLVPDDALAPAGDLVPQATSRHLATSRERRPDPWRPSPAPARAPRWAASRHPR